MLLRVAARIGQRFTRGRELPARSLQQRRILLDVQNPGAIVEFGVLRQGLRPVDRGVVVVAHAIRGITDVVQTFADGSRVVELLPYRVRFSVERQGFGEIAGLFGDYAAVVIE